MPKRFVLFPSATFAISITQPLHEFSYDFNAFSIEFTAGRKYGTCKLFLGPYSYPTTKF